MATLATRFTTAVAVTAGLVTLAAPVAGATPVASGPTTCATDGVCVLSSTASPSLNMSNNAKLAVAGNVVVSSSANPAADVEGSANVTAAAIGVVGVARSGNAGTYNPTPLVSTGAVNPFASSTAPTTSGGTVANGVANGGSVTLSPGTYTSLGAQNGARLTLNPGVYVVTSSFFNTGGSTITGSGVTIVLQGTATVSLSNGTSTTLTNASNGFVLYYASGAAGSLTVSGSSAVNLTGAIYAPQSAANIQSNLDLTGPLVVNTLTIGSGAGVDVLAGWEAPLPGAGITGFFALAGGATLGLGMLSMLGRRRRVAA